MHTETNIVILDGHTTNPGDLSWEPLEALGQLRVYDRTPASFTVERAKGAHILFTNKTVLDGAVMDQLPDLRFISVLATGYNAVDVAAAHARGIPVSNVRGYSTHSVAQHVFALLFELTNRVVLHHVHVRNGGWSVNADWSYTLKPTVELKDKTIGIVGLGLIGNKVADIALALGMHVLACRRHPKRDARPGVTFAELPELLRQSDVVTLHVPLNRESKGLIHRGTLSLMKPSSILVNTGRGGLIVENDLLAALRTGTIAAAALDVMEREPPPPNHPFFALDNCLITPHLAWATTETRTRLISESAANVRAFLQGKPRNVIESY